VVKEIYRERVRVLTELWGSLVEKYTHLTREVLVDLLKESYETNDIKPIRGFKAEDLYEKELISLYVVGKEGLGLFNDYKEVFEKLLMPEIVIDRASEILIENKPIEAFELLQKDKGSLAKVLRLIFIQGIFSFKPEENLYIAMRNLDFTNIDEMKHTAVSFARFYTAFKVAEGIAEKTIKDKMNAEAFKRALAISIGIKYPLPKPEYISLIGKEVFNIDQKLLKKVLG